MRVLYITHAGFDTPGPNNQMAEVMFNDFLDRGYRLDVIQSHTKGINPDVPESLSGKDNFTCNTIVRKQINKSHFIKRYIGDVIYYFRTMKYWLTKGPYDIIFVQSGPTVVFLLLLLKLFKFRTPILYSIYDVFPGHAYDIGVIKSRFLYNALRWLQKPCYKIPKVITVLSEDMKDIVVREGASPMHTYVVPAWFDVTTTREIPDVENRFIKKYNIDTTKFYVQFAGTIGYVFNYKTVIEVAKRLADEKDIVFQMVGDGTTKEVFVKEATDLGLTNIQFYPLQPVEIVPDVYSACDVCLIPLMKGVIGNGVPSKLPILMACRRLTITAVESWSQYMRMINDNNMGLTADVLDYDALAAAILYVRDNPQIASEMVENAYHFGKENFSSVRSLQILADIFTNYSHATNR